MKQSVLHILLLPAYFLLMCLNSPAQQKFMHTASKENISCNYDCTLLDMPDLTNNPAAVIFVTPVLDKGIIQNPHPIGAYYFKSQWHIFNLDNKPVPAGARFNVEYYPNADETHFQYSFSRADIQADGSAFIDNWHLNNNPTVRFTSFLSWNPATQGAVTNREETTVQYNPAAGKWQVSNTNNKPMVARVTYNIAITWPGRVNAQIITPRTSTVINELTVAPNSNQLQNPVTGIFMTAWVEGVKLPGENSSVSHAEQTELTGFVMGASGADRKNNYETITIRFRSGIPATIQLLNAFIRKRSMVFLFDAISSRITTGQEAISYTIKLTDASISSYKQVIQSGEYSAGNRTPFTAYDEIKILFKKIEYKNSAGEVAEEEIK